MMVKLFFITSSFVVLCGIASAQLLEVPGVPEVPEAPALKQSRTKVIMRQVFKTGNTYRYVSENVVRIQLPGQGIREAKVEQQTRLVATPRLDQRPGVMLRGRVERLKVEFRSGNEQVVYDSFEAEDRGSPLGKHFRNALTQALDLKLNETMTIQSVSQAGREGSGTSIPGVPNFGTEDIEKLVAELSQGLPEAATRSGESWSLDGERTLFDIGTLQFTVHYRHAGEVSFEAIPCQEIKVGGDLGGQTLVPTEGGALAGKPLTFKGGSMNGRIVYDPAVSSVRLRELSVSLLLEIPGHEEGTVIQIPVEQQTTTRLLHVIPTP